MKSRAAIGVHPIHPMLVPLPIGSFFLAFVSDLVHAYTGSVFWYEFSSICIGCGIVLAALAAVFGLIDYFGVNMSPRGRVIATWHARVNVVLLLIYAGSLWARWGERALHTSRWPLAMALQVIAFAMLGVSGWLGGNLSYEHKVGVVEGMDPEATEIGTHEPAR